MINKLKSQPWWVLAGLAVIVSSLVLRFWQITANQFLFYDEGMYLGYNRRFLDLVAANQPKNISELFIILGLMIKTALGTAKAFWFFLLNLRVFTWGAEAWYFARVISALAGVATIVLTYLFAKRYFQSQKIALLSAVFLSILPSHIFYSRLGMQESLSALLFLAALYLYVFYKSLNWQTILASILLVLLYLTNYRMIIAPIFIIAIELFESFRKKETINWVKAAVSIAVFGALVFIIGSLYDGINRYVTFGWMSHQAQDAQGQRDLISFLSYPYYVFALEGLFFGLIFWGNIYLVIKQQWSKLLPFGLVLLQMGIFSLAAEKGARYLCVVLPFMVIAAAVFADYALSLAHKKYVIGVVVLACLFMSVESLKIAFSKTDYDKAVSLILSHDPQAKILSTQALTEQLYSPTDKNILECPKNLGDVVELYRQGYHYLIVDPQVYISWTKDEQRFSPPLIDFMETIYHVVPPLASFDHLNGTILNRFVLDHNQRLGLSLKFLKDAPEKKYGQIKIYDLGMSLSILKRRAEQEDLEKVR